jgi:Protein of unknown function (DUF1214)
MAIAQVVIPDEAESEVLTWQIAGKAEVIHLSETGSGTGARGSPRLPLADGTIDIYFGPTAPQGLESNWLPTGEDFFLVFRLYGPEPALFNKTWTLADVEKVK